MFGGSRYNPLTVVRRSLASCPDEAIDPTTAELAFVTDPDLRKSLRLDISAVNSALSNGEWKAATVLAGSVVEALLLWAIADLRASNVTGYNNAISKAVSSGALPKTPPINPEEWILSQFIAVAQQAAIIDDDTASQCQLARGFRNLIHLGRAVRLGQACNRGTALSAVAAVEHVIEDFQ